MFGALAGKLLGEGRRPILLNQWVPENHRVSCQGGKGDCRSKKYIENFKKRIYFQPSQYYIFSIPATISNVLLLFWALYSFLKSHIKVKFTYLWSTLNIPRRISIPSQKHGQQEFFSFVMEKKRFDELEKSGLFLIFWSLLIDMTPNVRAIVLL